MSQRARASERGQKTSAIDPRHGSAAGAQTEAGSAIDKIRGLIGNRALSHGLSRALKERSTRRNGDQPANGPRAWKHALGVDFGDTDSTAEREARAVVKHGSAKSPASSVGTNATPPSSPLRRTLAAAGFGEGRGMPLPLRARFESGLGHSLAGVRLHDDPRAHESAFAFGARAYHDERIFLEPRIRLLVTRRGRQSGFLSYIRAASDDALTLSASSYESGRLVPGANEMHTACGECKRGNGSSRRASTPGMQRTWRRGHEGHRAGVMPCRRIAALPFDPGLSKIW